MKFLVSLVPLLLFPFLLVIAHIEGYLEWTYRIDFMFVVAAMSMVLLAIEKLKAAIFVPIGSLIWLDFIVSLSLLIGIIVYMLKNEWQDSFYPLVLVLIAVVSDVVVGFFISISNARRDFGMS